MVESIHSSENKQLNECLEEEPMPQIKNFREMSEKLLMSLISDFLSTKCRNGEPMIHGPDLARKRVYLARKLIIGSNKFIKKIDFYAIFPFYKLKRCVRGR